MNLFTYVDNDPVNFWDLLGLLKTDIKYPTFETKKISTAGLYHSNEKLDCKCVSCEGQGPDCKQLQCTLTATPVIQLHPNQELQDLFQSLDKYGLTTKEHELLHHQVFQKVHVPSYEHLVSLYEDCCGNCEEAKKELLQNFDKLVKLVHQWESVQELQKGLYPVKEYGGSKKVLQLKGLVPSLTSCPASP